MVRRMLMAAGIGLAALAAPVQAADYLFSYGITTGSPTPTVYASGTISTGASCGTGCFYVTNVTGTNRGQAITSYDPTNYDEFFPNNASMRTDGLGITYGVGTTTYNIFSTGGGYTEIHADSAGSQIGSSAYASFFTVSAAPAAAVPEAGTWGTVIGGLALAGIALRRRRSVSVRAAA